MNVKEMTWAYRLQGTRTDENIKIYWFVHIIKLFISDLSVFMFKFFLKFSFAHLFNYLWFVHFFELHLFVGASFVIFWSLLCIKGFTKVSFQDVFIELLFLFFINYYFDGNGSGFECIKYVYSLTKNVLHKY